MKLEREIAGRGDPTEDEKKELKQLKALYKRASEHSAFLNQISCVKRVLEFATPTLRLGIKGDEWDRIRHLIACQNVVINLETQSVAPPRADYYIRTVAAIKYDKKAKCPEWEKSLVEIFDGDLVLPHYVKRILGYAMSGYCTESDFLIWHGDDGRNGKEFILERVRNVVGDKMAGVIESELLLAAKQQRGKNASTEGLMVLRGRRVAWASETNEGRVLDLATMKDLSGGHILTGRHNHGRQVEWKRSHTLILLTNHKPHINSQSLAEWDRIRLLQFPLSFVNDPDPDKPNQRKKDKDLGNRIDKAELPGIFNWLLEGFADWLDIGLSEPGSVKRDTDLYRSDEDTLAHFISEACVVKTDIKVKTTELYKAYLAWVDQGSRPMGKKPFYQKIEKRGFRKKPYDGYEYFDGLAARY